jgi:hypothetical protein
LRQRWDVTQVRIITVDGTDTGWLESFEEDGPEPGAIETSVEKRDRRVAGYDGFGGSLVTVPHT